MDYKAISKAITDPENQPHQWNDQELAEFFVSAADEIERLRETLATFAIQSKDNLNKKDDEIERLREALRTIGYGPPHEGEPLELLNQFVDLARSALQQKESE